MWVSWLTCLGVAVNLNRCFIIANFEKEFIDSHERDRVNLLKVEKSNKVTLKIG